MIPIAARRKAMWAAMHTETSTCREAAIVGAVVRNLVSTGRYSPDWVAQTAADIIGEFNLVGVDRTVPGPTEVAYVVERFQQAYGRTLAA